MNITLIKDLITNETTLFFICMGFALLLGLFQAFLYTIKNRYTKSFVATLTLLPVSVSLVILLINGSLGLGIAVAGAFSLVRFRSIPGTGKEIVAIFIAMVTGLAVGAKYFEYAVIFNVIGSVVLLILNLTKIFEPNKHKQEKILKITIPEDLNYTNVFEDLFKKYTNNYERTSVKSINMGSMFRITYRLTIKDVNLEKEFIDELRCRNGNLEISMYDDSYEEVTL